MPGRVSQSVGHLTRKSGVLGSIPGLAKYFRFSFRFSKKGSCQLLAKVCARSTGYRLGGLSLPRKSVIRLTDRPDMTLDVYRGRKTTMQQQQQSLDKSFFWNFAEINFVFYFFAAFRIKMFLCNLKALNIGSNVCCSCSGHYFLYFQNEKEEIYNRWQFSNCCTLLLNWLHPETL